MFLHIFRYQLHPADPRHHGPRGWRGEEGCVLLWEGVLWAGQTERDGRPDRQCGHLKTGVGEAVVRKGREEIKVSIGKVWVEKKNMTPQLVHWNTP